MKGERELTYYKALLNLLQRLQLIIKKKEKGENVS